MPDTSDAPGMSPAKPHKEEPGLNALGLREPARGEPVSPPHPDKPAGERQDGPGAGPERPVRTEATPAGSTAARRAGSDAGPPEEPDAAHRGQPATFGSGTASGSGSGAGGAATVRQEEPDPDSAGGGGREVSAP